MTGREKWQFKTGGEVRSSPAVSNGIVYIGSSDKNLYAIDAATGRETWRFATGDNVFSSPAVSNGLVFAGSLDGNMYAIGVPSSPVIPTGVSSPEFQSSSTPLLPAYSDEIPLNWVGTLYNLIVGILLIEIFVEGWKAFKTDK